MTHDYNKAWQELYSASCCGMNDVIAKTFMRHHETVIHALTIAAEYEQVRKERDELATAIIKIHEDQEGDYDFLKFISYPQYILSKKVIENE